MFTNDRNEKYVGKENYNAGKKLTDINAVVQS